MILQITTVISQCELWTDNVDSYSTENQFGQSVEKQVIKLEQEFGMAAEDIMPYDIVK